MEGISQEAIALAGHLKLNRLIVLFDDNGISIDGPLSLSDSADQVKRFEAAGWSATRIDGHDPDAIAAAIERAQKSDRPTLIACKTTIGFGAPTKAGKSSSHGSPLGADEIAGARKKLRLGVARRSKCRPTSSMRGAPPAQRSKQARMPTGTSGLARSTAEQARRVRAPHARRPAEQALADAVEGVKEKLAAEPKDIATRTASEFALESAGAGGAGDDRRLGRPHRLEQHPHQGDEGDRRRGLRRPLHPLRHPRARHGRRDERHGAAWRHHPLLRHVPGVLRLLPARRSGSRR